MATLTSLVNSGLGYFSNRVKSILDANFTALNTAVVSSADIVNDTTPQLGGQLDVNGNSIGSGTLELLSFVETASAVNEITITNNATSLPPSISATGGDSNINLKIASKGSGKVNLVGGIQTSTTTTSSGAGAVAITGAIHEITTTGADALTLANGAEGQILNVVMVSDGGDGTLTPTSFANGSTLTFDNNDTAQLLFTAGAWYFMGGNAVIA